MAELVFLVLEGLDWCLSDRKGRVVGGCGKLRWWMDDGAPKAVDVLREG